VRSACAHNPQPSSSRHGLDEPIHAKAHKHTATGCTCARGGDRHSQHAPGSPGSGAAADHAATAPPGPDTPHAMRCHSLRAHRPGRGKERLGCCTQHSGLRAPGTAPAAGTCCARDCCKRQRGVWAVWATGATGLRHCTRDKWLQGLHQ